MRPETLRAQLTLWNGAFLFAIVLAFGLGLYGVLARNLYRSTDQKLSAIAEVVAESSVRNFLRPGFTDFARLLEEFFGMPTAGQFIQVLDPSGNVGSRSPNLEARRLKVSPQAYQSAAHGHPMYETVADHPAPMRVLTYPVVVRGRVRNIVQVATSLATVNDTLRHVTWVLAVGIPSLLLAAMAGGWFLSGRSLAPLDSMVEAIHDLDADNLDARLPETGRTLEVRELTRNFNSLLGRLEGAFRRVKEFTADASHELRTPLTVLRGEAEVALLQPRSPEEYQRVLASSLEEIQRMGRIVEDLLLLTRGELGEVPVERSSLSLDQLLEEVAAQTEMLAEAQEVGFTWAGGPPVTVCADPLRLRQLFWNLLGNAVKYTPAGGQVFLSHSVIDGREVRITVKDTGIGIPPEHLPHIFERFYRVDKHRSRAQGGSGLGLPICQWIVQVHGGRIEVRSVPEAGSSFLVYLPIHPGTRDECSAGTNTTA
ncbi:MAG TPA: heavy metal sensor histidine kinase [Deferrisomatales bacterium]|nr:heavy metal sensor histidine kinase [Deferrisomatales bacterium]